MLYRTLPTVQKSRQVHLKCLPLRIWTVVLVSPNVRSPLTCCYQLTAHRSSLKLLALTYYTDCADNFAMTHRRTCPSRRLLLIGHNNTEMMIDHVNQFCISIQMDLQRLKMVFQDGLGHLLQARVSRTSRMISSFTAGSQDWNLRPPFYWGLDSW